MASRFFGNYEFIEQVLLLLPLRQILLAQRINKACYDVISRSQSIQQVLFLSPSASIVHAEPEKKRYGYSWKEDGGSKRKALIFNPFLDIRNVSTYSNKVSERKQLLGNKDAIILAQSVSEPLGRGLICRRRQNLRPLGTRAKMLFSHPPTTELRLHGLNSCRTYIGDAAGSGTTYGELISTASSGWSKSLVKKGRALFYLPETRDWLQFSGTIDTITGVEMLEMLQMDADQLLEEGLAFHWAPDDEEEGKRADQYVTMCFPPGLPFSTL